jgi:hypothetical protein
VDAGLIGVAGLIVVDERAPGTEVALRELALDQPVAEASEDGLVAVADVAADTPVQQGVVVVRLRRRTPRVEVRQVPALLPVAVDPLGRLNEPGVVIRPIPAHHLPAGAELSQPGSYLFG